MFFSLFPTHFFLGVKSFEFRIFEWKADLRFVAFLHRLVPHLAGDRLPVGKSRLPRVGRLPVGQTEQAQEWAEFTGRTQFAQPAHTEVSAGVCECMHACVFFRRSLMQCVFLLASFGILPLEPSPGDPAYLQNYSSSMETQSTASSKKVAATLN